MRWKLYTMFAYLVCARPPFAIAAATRHFRIASPPLNSTDGFLADGGGLRYAGEVPPSAEDRHGNWVQFPMGLWRARDALHLSWGERDAFTLLTRIRVDALRFERLESCANRERLLV